MPLNLRKDKSEILQKALKTLETRTPITATSPGSVARALAEAITSEIGDFYDLMDYNVSQTLISKANSSALDRIGSLYGVDRRSLSSLNVLEANTGTFHFYIEQPYHSVITIPAGTRLYSNSSDYVSTQIQFETINPTVIPIGRRKVYTAIRPVTMDIGLTLGKDTLTVHNFVSPPDTLVYGTNGKPISGTANTETDDNYRTRIINQLRVNTGGTLTALRFAALAVEGVRDVRIKSARYGLGTMEMLVVSENGLVPDSVRSRVSNALESARPAGVRLYLRSPVYVSFGIGVGLVMRSGSTNETRDAVARAEMSIRFYLNSLMPGDKLIYSQLISGILDASDLVSDVKITNYSANDLEVSRTNYEPGYDEQIVPGTITVSRI